MENSSSTHLPAPLETILTVGASVIVSSRYSSIGSGFLFWSAYLQKLIEVFVAVYTLCVYDWLVSIAEECELIWDAPFTTMKLVYIVCRYYPLLIFPLYLWTWLGDHTQEFCSRMVHPLYGAVVIYPLSAQAVIMMRAYAFTGRNRATLWTLCTCYFALAGTEIWLFGHWFELEAGIFQLLGNTGCYANDAGAVKLSFQYGRALGSAIVMVSRLSFDTLPLAHHWCGQFAAFLMDVLMTGIVFMHCYRNRSFQGALGKFFVLQGFVAFLIMAALNLTSAVTYFQNARQYDGIVFPFLLVVPDVLVGLPINSFTEEEGESDGELSTKTAVRASWRCIERVRASGDGCGRERGHIHDHDTSRSLGMKMGTAKDLEIRVSIL
ncbi:hypothetical protein D9758_012035 [Tetrapyrgos nigripes]|uniref:DUF6533 domain-containing protein n=1 Tax=Tetrapyrgos nigripes TaxID=182062 RepID=A0A8H5CPY9_9AGAR|nr:hypothetical protein D9758_012035 [Tetrapyrgos nigripes]